MSTMESISGKVADTVARIFLKKNSTLVMSQDFSKFF